MSAPTEEFDGHQLGFGLASGHTMSPFAEAVVIDHALTDYPETGPAVDAVRQKVHELIGLSALATLHEVDTVALESGVRDDTTHASGVRKAFTRAAKSGSISPDSTGLGDLSMSAEELRMSAEAGLKFGLPGAIVDAAELTETKANTQKVAEVLPGGDVLAPFSDPAERKIVEKALRLEARRKSPVNPPELFTHQTGRPSEARTYFSDEARLLLREAFSRPSPVRKVREFVEGVGGYVRIARTVGTLATGSLVKLRNNK